MTATTLAACRAEHARCHDLYLAHLPCFICSRGRLCGIGRPLHDDADDAGRAWERAERRELTGGRR